MIAAEISTLTRYCSEIIQWRPRVHDDLGLLAAIEAPQRSIATGPSVNMRDNPGSGGSRVLLLNGTLNYHTDIQQLLRSLGEELSRQDRVVIVAYNPYLSWMYRAAAALGIWRGEPPTTFVTRTDVANLARLSKFEVVRYRPTVYLPWRLLGFGSLVNSLLPAIPLLRHLALAAIITLRPLGGANERRPALSVVIPARNELGNIAPAIERMPDLQTDLEVIFVEGHSTDGTWEEIQRVASTYKGPIRIVALQQRGKGKADAVRTGFHAARGEVLAILDADLTMPPELLGRFFEAYCDGHGDFVNGTRLMYPMEGEAMRHLNRVGNAFFAKALSSVLDTRIGDSLCGTKLFSRADWLRMQRWRADFGDFDPFGDFEQLFPAAVLGLGIVDVPVAYRARAYGSTNISRFRHGTMLLKMTAIGLFRIKLGRW